MPHIIMISNLLLSLPITFPQSICHPALVHPSRFAFLRCKMTWATMCFDIIMMSKHIHFVQKPCCTWWVLLVQFESTFPQVIFPSKFCSPIKSDRRLALTPLPSHLFPPNLRILFQIMKSSGSHNWGIGWLMRSQVARPLQVSRPRLPASKICSSRPD